jgi:hypothetical protein
MVECVIEGYGVLTLVALLPTSTEHVDWSYLA